LEATSIVWSKFPVIMGNRKACRRYPYRGKGRHLDRNEKYN